MIARELPDGIEIAGVSVASFFPRGPITVAGILGEAGSAGSA